MLHFLSEPDKIDFRASAGGAGDDFRPALAQSEGTEQFPRHGHLFFRGSRQRDAQGVADALAEEDAHADRGFDGSAQHAARLGDAKVQRVIAAL